MGISDQFNDEVHYRNYVTIVTEIMFTNIILLFLFTIPNYKNIRSQLYNYFLDIQNSFMEGYHLCICIKCY